MRNLLLFNPENLSEEKNEELSAILKLTLKTSRAWFLQEWFRHFWEEKDAVGGRAFFESWYSRAIRSRLEPVKKVARVLKQRLGRIVTWFANPISNGRAGFNSRIQSIMSSGSRISSLRTLSNPNPLLLRET